MFELNYYVLCVMYVYVGEFLALFTTLSTCFMCFISSWKVNKYRYRVLWSSARFLTNI